MYAVAIHKCYIDLTAIVLSGEIQAMWVALFFYFMHGLV